MFNGSIIPPDEETTLSDPAEMEAEQAYIDTAYRRLEEIKREAEERARTQSAQRHTAFQAVYERDVAVQVALERAASLEIGDQALVFGRIDDEADHRYYVGRRAVFDERYRPLVIDWRVPSAEPFYRATGRHPMGLRLRRHFLCEGAHLVTIEDEHFGDGLDIGIPGLGALTAAMERPRTGHMRDIVATVQVEQDEIIRDGLPGILAVQGGPGTGKTAVGLHRAAFLLFTHRQKLERQGMLVIGPNRRFLRYIEQVLPSLGESGVELDTLAGLAPEVTLRVDDPEPTMRIKGDARMATAIARAIKTKQRSPAHETRVRVDTFDVMVSKREVAKLVKLARRNRRTHNARRSMLINILADRIYRRYKRAVRAKHEAMADELILPRREALATIRGERSFVQLLDEVWPLLTAQEIVGELLSSRALLNETTRDLFTDDERTLLYRDDREGWSASDGPLLDEASVRLGAPAERRRVVTAEDDLTDEIETYGHIIVDEAQDLTPMALRMIARRSRFGSITLVGDLAQAVGATPPGTWDDVLSHLPQPEGARKRELTVNYRTPGSIIEIAARVLAEATPGLKPPVSARPGGEPLLFIEEEPSVAVARLVQDRRAKGDGTMAVIAARADVDALREITHAREDDEIVAVLTPHEAKGLEFDEVVIVEPSHIVESSEQGMRALYVALTRATQRATIVHAEELPGSLRGAV